MPFVRDMLKEATMAEDEFLNSCCQLRVTTTQTPSENLMLEMINENSKGAQGIVCDVSGEGECSHQGPFSCQSPCGFPHI